MARDWEIKDLVDLEYFMTRDEALSGEELARRDRDFFLRQEEIPTKRPALFRRWVDFRRETLVDEAGDEGIAPGEAFAEVFSILHKVIPIAGLLSGAGIAMTLLQYHGTQAVNVSTYFGVLVVLQIVMLLLLVLATVYRKKISGRGLTAAYPLLSRLVYKWSSSIRASALGKLAGGKRAALATGVGELKIKKALYGRVLYHPVFQLVQVFGVLFNVGALGATLLRVFTRDIAFGWQSTVQVASGSVFNAVELLALPWRAVLGEGKGYPSLEQIEGSRMVLKEGMVNHATADLVSWWPFLCLCLVFYGLLPRLALWTYATVSGKKTLATLNFTHAGCERLYRRMTTPMLESASEVPAVARQKIRIEDGAANKNYAPPFAGVQGESTLLLIPEELVGELDSDLLIQIVEKSVGRSVSRTRPYSLGKKGLGELGIQPRESVTVYQEAWQPPIQEYLNLLRRLRRHVAPETALVILLNGRTKPDEAFAPVGETDRATWNAVIKTLGDPYIGVAEVITS